MISNSGHDENGRYSGGQAGDQTGTEWAIINWYNRPWKCVLRHPDGKVREIIASLAEKAAKNNNIGYDQGQRVSYWNELVKAKYDPSAIKTKCEADCSSGVMSNVKAAGYLLNNEKLKAVSITSTHYMREILRKAGFEVLTDSKYLTSDKYLLRGDVLLNDGHHTATNVTDGPNAEAGSTSAGKQDGNAGKGFKSTIKEFQEYLNRTYESVIKEYCKALLQTDDKYGSKSRAAALCAWKYEMNLLKTGYVFDLSNSNFGSQCRKYGNKAIVKKGCKGRFVYLAQGILRAKGCYTGELDGDAGTLTDSAVRAWQKAKGLAVDGECGADTWNSLFN